MVIIRPNIGSISQIIECYQKYNVVSYFYNTILLESYEKWRWNLDISSPCCILLTGLNKSFDCIVHEFLIAKLVAYCFTYGGINVMKNYLWDRTHRAKLMILIDFQICYQKSSMFYTKPSCNMYCCFSQRKRL